MTPEEAHRATELRLDDLDRRVKVLEQQKRVIAHDYAREQEPRRCG